MYISCPDTYVSVRSNYVVLQYQTRARSRCALAASRVLPVPLEPFAVNKEMGRILIRRAGETIAAGTSTVLLLLQRVADR